MQQQELIAGDTLNFVTETPGYSAADGWVLHYRLVPRTAGAAAVELTSAPEGAAHRVQAAPASTGEWAPGAYSWVAWVDRDGEVYTVDNGQITIRPNPRTVASGYDGRSVAQRALDDAKAALASWNPLRRRYRIGDREMEFSDTESILRLIAYWDGEVAKEDLVTGRVKAPARRIMSRI